MTARVIAPRNQPNTLIRVTSRRLLGLALMVGLLFGASTGGATTVTPMTLAEIKKYSGAIVVAQVRNLTYTTRGREIRPLPPEKGEPPAADGLQAEPIETVRPGIGASELRPSPMNPSDPRFDLSLLPGAPATDDATNGPIGVGVESGLMPYTFVEIFIHDMRGDLEGSGPGWSFIYLVAGGQSGNFETRVMGIPQLDVGQAYILFLYPDLTGTAVPYVGLEQGVFPIVKDERSGREAVTDAHGRPVIAIEDGEVIVRASQEDLEEFEVAWTPAPVARDEGTRTQSRLPQTRFWSSREPALSPSEFMDLVDRL